MMIMLDFSLLIGDLSLFKETLKKGRWRNVFVCLFVFFSNYSVCHQDL